MTRGDDGVTVQSGDESVLMTILNDSKRTFTTASDSLQQCANKVREAFIAAVFGEKPADYVPKVAAFNRDGLDSPNPTKVEQPVTHHTARERVQMLVNGDTRTLTASMPNERGEGILPWGTRGCSSLRSSCAISDIEAAEPLFRE